MNLKPNLDPKNTLMLAAAGGLVAMGLDAGINHFALRELKHLAQLAPVIFGPLAGGVVALLVLAGAARSAAVARGVGVLSMALGAIGTAFHLRPFVMLLEDSTLETALRIAPPLMAPGAFVALGALLVFAASPAVVVRLVSKTA